MLPNTTCNVLWAELAALHSYFLSQVLVGLFSNTWSSNNLYDDNFAIAFTSKILYSRIAVHTFPINSSLFLCHTNGLFPHVGWVYYMACGKLKDKFFLHSCNNGFLHFTLTKTQYMIHNCPSWVVDHYSSPRATMGLLSAYVITVLPSTLDLKRKENVLAGLQLCHSLSSSE